MDNSKPQKKNRLFYLWGEIETALPALVPVCQPAAADAIRQLALESAVVRIPKRPTAYQVFRSRWVN